MSVPRRLRRLGIPVVALAVAGFLVPLFSANEPQAEPPPAGARKAHVPAATAPRAAAARVPSKLGDSEASVEEPRAAVTPLAAPPVRPLQGTRQPRLQVEDLRGVALEARVSTLEGTLLVAGRSPLLVPGQPGDLVRVEAAGRVPEVLPLPSGEGRVSMASGRLLRGSVLAAESSQPIAGARVEAHTALASTDSRGRFELVVCEEGPPELRVVAAGRPSVLWRGEEPARIEVPRGIGARARSGERTVSLLGRWRCWWSGSVSWGVRFAFGLTPTATSS